MPTNKSLKNLERELESLKRLKGRQDKKHSLKAQIRRLKFQTSKPGRFAKRVSNVEMRSRSIKKRSGKRFKKLGRISGNIANNIDDALRKL